MGQSPIEDVDANFFAAGIEPLMIRKDGTPVWPIFGGSGEDDTDEDTGEEDEDTGDEDGDDDEDEADKAKTATKKLDPKTKQLHDENSRRRNENKQLTAELTTLKAKLKEHEDANLGETEKVTKERDEFKEKAERLEQSNRQLSLTNAFLQDKTNDWHNPKAALKLLDLDGVKIDEDGEVEGLDEAITKLAKENPYLVKGQKQDDEDEDEKTSGSRNQASGQPVSKTKAEKTRQALEKKYRL